MHTNGNNGKGQERVVSVRLLEEYCEWLNSSLGESFLRVTTGQTSNGKYTLTITSSLGIGSSGNPYVVAEGETGLGTVYWDRTTTDSSTVSTSGNGSVTISAGTQLVTSGMYPKGKFHLEYDGRKYLELNNTNTTSYTGYDTMIVTGATDMTKCVTYHDITASTYVRYFNEQTMLDGLIVTGYSVGDGKLRYDDNQLVVQKDIEFGKFQYNLEVESITVEVDAMTDATEYAKGVIPGLENLAFASVYDVTNTTKTRFTNFTINELTDNSATNGKTYANLKIEKYGSIATAPIENGKYTLDVYYYNDSDYTLTSTTVTATTGVATTSSITVSNHSFSSTSTASTASATSMVVKVTIGSNGEVSFGIKQRKEIYGYFPVDVYRASVDENGNVALSAQSQFINAVTGTSSTVYSSSDLYKRATGYTVGWLSNAGDNFGADALNSTKSKLEASDESAYYLAMTSQGLSGNELLVCGKDVYNTEVNVYDRGVNVGSSYHMAYANDAYGNMDFTGGLKGTAHLFSSGGTMISGTPSHECSDCEANPYSYECGYLEYTYDEFNSEYSYPMKYRRNYYNDCHSYGKTSILRRFRKIGDYYIDSSISSYATVNTTSPMVSGIVSGDTFPKHISGKTVTIAIDIDWLYVNGIKSGTHNVSGWTTVYETAVTNSDLSTVTTSSPTERNVYVYLTWNELNRIHCEKNTDDSIDYINIAPKFYMVDAESCSGATSSGYTFQTPLYIQDLTNGTTSDRYYKLESNGYLTEYVNTQKKLMPMLSYNNVSGSSNTVAVGSNRYGISGKYIRTGCSPQAPFQVVSWIDSYAPSVAYDGYLISGQTTYFINSDNVLVDGVAASSKCVLPTTYDTNAWRNLDENNDGIDINDINRFESGSGYYSFAGRVYYPEDAQNNGSSHNINQSISYAVDHSIPYWSTVKDDLGYEVFEEGIFGTTPLRAVSSDTIDFDGNTYSGDTFIYYLRKSETNILMGGYTSGSSFANNFKFLPFQAKYNPTDNIALRPCFGYVTCPYWTATLNFIVRHPTGSFADPIAAFDMAPSVNGVQLTTGGTTNNGIFYSLVNTSTTIVTLENGNSSKPGIYGYLSKVGEPIQDSGSSGTSQKMCLYLLFVDVNTVDTHNVKIICNANEGANTDSMRTQGLSWHLDANKSNAVGATVLSTLGTNQWGDYESNYDSKDLRSGPAAIGNVNQYSVASVMNLTNRFYEFFVSDDAPSFGVTTSTYPKASRTNVKDHAGLYW